VGEPQILGQLKGAFDAASRAGTVGTLLGRCFTRAFAVAKRVRTETTIAEGSVPGFAPPTTLYFLMRALSEQIVGYEARVSISGPASDTWIITRGSSAGIDVDPDPDGYVVGIGVCAGDVGGSYVMNTYAFAFFTAPNGPNDTLICAGAPTVFNPTFPGFPAYQTCSGILGTSELADTGGTCPVGCAIINPVSSCAVAVERGTWSSLKASS